MTKAALNLIDGQWLGDDDVERRKPGPPWRGAVTAPALDAGSAEAALSAAAAAQPVWSVLPSPVYCTRTRFSHPSTTLCGCRA